MLEVSVVLSPPQAIRVFVAVARSTLGLVRRARWSFQVPFGTACERASTLVLVAGSAVAVVRDDCATAAMPLDPSAMVFAEEVLP